MRTFIVGGNYGKLAVDWDTGRAISYEPEPGCDPGYDDIFWFHVEEFKRYYGYDGPDGWQKFKRQMLGGYVDILEIGFWSSKRIGGGTGLPWTYTPPEEDWRTEMRRCRGEMR